MGRVRRLGADAWLRAARSASERPYQSEGRKSNLKPQASNFVRSFSRPDHVSHLQRHWRGDRVQRTSAERGGGRREISELTRDIALSKGQRPFWIAQIQACPDRSEPCNCVRRPA